MEDRKRVEGEGCYLGNFKVVGDSGPNECCTPYQTEYITLARKWYQIPLEERMRAEESVKQEDIKLQQFLKGSND